MEDKNTIVPLIEKLIAVKHLIKSYSFTKCWSIKFNQWSEWQIKNIKNCSERKIVNTVDTS